MFFLFQLHGGSHFTYKFNLIVCHFFNVCFFRNNSETNMFYHVPVHVMGEIRLFVYQSYIVLSVLSLWIIVSVGTL